MLSFMMKTLTVNNVWFPFSLHDIPCRIDENTFALLNRPFSPLLQLDKIRRGDYESGYYEGDIIDVNGVRNIICYKRGFYAINEEYQVTNLYQLPPATKYLDQYDGENFSITVPFRHKQLYTYNGVQFRLDDIVGKFEDKILVRMFDSPIPPGEIKQECCMSYNDKRLYLGDDIEGKPAELHGGRVTIVKDDGVYDLGGRFYLDDYNSKYAG